MTWLHHKWPENNIHSKAIEVVWGHIFYLYKAGRCMIITLSLKVNLLAPFFTSDISLHSGLSCHVWKIGGFQTNTPITHCVSSDTGDGSIMLLLRVSQCIKIKKKNKSQLSKPRCIFQECFNGNSNFKQRIVRTAPTVSQIFHYALSYLRQTLVYTLKI